MIVVSITLLMLVSLMGIQRARADTGTPIDSFGFSGTNAGTSKLFCMLLFTNGGNACVGISGRLLKDTVEQDSNHDYYGVAASAWAANGTGGPNSVAVTDMTASIQFPNSIGVLTAGPLSG